MGNLIEYRCGLIDFQVGRDHGKLSFDPAEYIRSCARSNMKRVMFTCKDAYGDAYYKTDLVEQNPMAGSNYFQIAIDECRANGIEIYAYYNILLDDIYADEYPDHRMVNKDGEKAIAYDYYKSLCPNSPYIDVISERVADLVFNYDMDGIFFDITYFSGSTCFCGNCKEKFRQDYGYELMNSIQPGSDEFADFNEFRRNSRAELLTRLADIVREMKSIPVIWNGSGSFYLAEPETDDYSDYLTTEFHAPDFLDGIVRAKWMQTRKKGFIMSTPCEMGSWGDWTMIPKSTLRSTVCSIASHGGGVFFNHTPYPSGEFADSYINEVEENIGESFRYLEKFEKFLKNSESAADAAVLFSIESKRFCENGYGGYDPGDFTASLKGAVKMMLESGIPFDVVDDRNFASLSSNYQLLIIPLAPQLPDRTVEALTGFVKGGGFLVTCSESAEKIEKILGTKSNGFSDISVEYITDMKGFLSKGVPNMPILIKNAGKLPNMRRLNEAEALAKKTLPPFEATIQRHVYHMHAHPYERSEYDSICMNKYGEGNAVCFSADVFRSYKNTASPWLKKIFQNSFKATGYESILQISAPDCVYPTLMKNDSGYILQLMNINGPMIEPGKAFPENMLTVYRTGISTKLNVKRAYSPVTGREYRVHRENGACAFTIDEINIHEAIILETGDKE
ncbi:MAG: alpha-L-fucosidase [Clostridia bacterium]|nr:alpha-L-fucosidase [Clostridia bacterium]